MSDWKVEYKSLVDFIAGHTEIVISPNEISIPQNLRDEFYERFDKTRGALVESQYRALPVDVDRLCSHFLAIENDVVAQLGIERVSMPVDLHSFLHTPKEGMTRAIYTRLFDLLQGKITADVFEKQFVDDLTSSALELYRLGYEWWAGLTVIKLLEPDEAYLVDLDDDYKPVLAELKEIAFGRQAHHPTMRIPEFVLHSKKLCRYVAVKMAIAREVETYVAKFKPPVRPKKRTGDTSSALDSRVMFLSILSSKEDIPVLADTYELTLTSPDWMVECITASEFQDPAALDQVKDRVSSLNPRLGMCLIVIDHEESQALEPLAESIHPVSVGFDETKLLPVVSALT
jgi:hypothetical protein